MTGNTLTATVILTVLLQSVWSIIAPPLPPLVINSLAYADGMIVQDRMVNTDGPFTAVWEARIVDRSTGKTVPGCIGTGVWSYPSGAKVPKFPVAEWVGNDLCYLGPGFYIAEATYSAGEFRTTGRSEVFEVKS